MTGTNKRRENGDRRQGWRAHPEGTEAQTSNYDEMEELERIKR